ncbi:MAG: 50S ribosomal protein L29 [bacterium]|nr:50S ribosomal protein L29 [bacterium]
MKTKEKKELNSKSTEELKILLGAAEGELSLLKLENFRKKLKNTSSVTMKRKEIAKILTIIKQKELEKEILEVSK